MATETQMDSSLLAAAGHTVVASHAEREDIGPVTPPHLLLNSASATTLGMKSVSLGANLGINILTNGAVSLIFTKLYHYLIDKSSLSNGVHARFEGAARWFHRKNADPSLKDLFNTKRVIMENIETAVMCIAGTAMMKPYKWLKDNRRRFGYRLDAIYERWGLQQKGTAAAVAAARGEDTEHPQEEPLRWKDLLLSRALSLVLAIFAGHAFEKHATGQWFAKLHPAGSDTLNHVYYRDESGRLSQKEEVIERGKNFKYYALKFGQKLSRRTERTWLGEAFHVRASTNPYVLRPSGSEETVRIVLKEYALTGILGVTMPIFEWAFNGLRGKQERDSEPAASRTVVQPPATNAAASNAQESQARTHWSSANRDREKVAYRQPATTHTGGVESRRAQSAEAEMAVAGVGG